MKPLFSIIFLLSICFSAGAATIQVPSAGVNTQLTDSVKNTDLSLGGQYRFMLSRSRTVNGYKMINPYRLSALWTSVNDTLRKERGALKSLTSKLAEHEATIARLQTEAATIQSAAKENQTRINAINFLGMSIDKGMYSIIVWSVIAVLGIALFVTIARSAKNVMEAKNKHNMYDELLTEYQNFKSKANEKERKLARELQDERNLLEELKAKGK